jgi:predicted secreted Zn-dependent protease
MRKLAMIIATLGLVLATAPAFAQKGDKGKPKVKTYDFTGDTIEGDLIKPEGEAVNARDITQFSSLIRIRREFINEIIKAAEDL